MAPLLILLFAVIAYWYFKLKIRHLPSDQQKALLKKWLIIAGVAVFALFALVKGQFIVGVIAAIFAAVMRLTPLLKYLPIIKTIIGQTETRNTRANSADADPVSGAMSKVQAAKILGVGENSSEDEIVEAHRRLMQKVHPDRGGSTELAAQINEAKKTLLS